MSRRNRPALSHSVSTICRTSAGEIRVCSDCGDMELSFGNLVLGLSVEDLTPLLHRIAELQAIPATIELPVIYLAETGVGIRFTRSELIDLRGLLETALSHRVGTAMGAFTPRHAPTRSSLH